MKNIYLVKCINTEEISNNGFIDQVFDNLEEAQKYIKIQNDYWQSTKSKNWAYFLCDIKPLRTKALTSEEPLEETK